MNSRDAILQKIRSSMVPFPETSVPELKPLQPAENPSVETMKKTFADALESLTGRFFWVENLSDVRETLENLARENGWTKFSSFPHPLLESVLPREFFHGKGKKNLYLGEKGEHSNSCGGENCAVRGETDKNRLAELPVSLVFPQFLIAETGTCVVLNRSAHERLNCYLTPACVMIAPVSALRENLQSAWDSVAETTASSLTDETLRGEFVLVTGPSRTADIERVSVLGVHGPKMLAVIVYGE
ncbi:MAG: LUD domain-containing protein [Planctomycetia bacterium]|nr:LUD domain-containing protein [Planctomycetia bacterium]